MKRLASEFDHNQLSATVATPTCSSCCCCCCCLATTVASSSLLARRINREAKISGSSDRIGLTLLASLFVPVIGILIYSLYTVLNKVLQSCNVEHLSYGGDYSYCTTPASSTLIPLYFICTTFVLWYLYKRVHLQDALKRSILVTILITVAFVAEFFAGAAAILTGVGGIVYLCMVPIIVGWLNVWYNKHLRNEASDVQSPNETAATTFDSTQPPTPPEVSQ